MRNKIDFKSFHIFDGAMGTMLQASGMKMGELPESYNINRPEIIEDIHRQYINAGADIITTNTFGANSKKLKATGYTVQDVVKSAVAIARRSAGDKYVALDIGPIGQLMKPYGTLAFEEAYEIFKEQVDWGKEGADLILIETMSDIYEAKAAILAAKENSDLPVICTMTFQSDGRTLTGTDPLTMVNVLQGLGVDALGFNCSLGPLEMLPLLNDVLMYSKIPVIVQANAGLPKVVDGNTVFDVGAEAFGEYGAKMANMGVNILGGCCGTNPDYIRALKNAIKGLKPVARNVKSITAVSSYSNTVIIGGETVVIGERINPTGKSKIKAALKSGDIDYILREAIDQRNAGAHILDVNAGLPEIDEKASMVKLVKELQGIINLPLQIDSTSSEAIEAALRVYNGKPIINSVSGKEKSMEEIFPVAKKYGACVVGLTLDDSGIPEKAEDRLKIAERIVNSALEYGIDRENIIIDCLVLTASAQQKEVRETVKAVALVKERLNVKTILGVSNVSFGLPSRGILNRTFFAATLGAGLDAAIINPMSLDMMETVHSFNVLWNYDEKGEYFIKKYSEVKKDSQETLKSDRDLTSLVIDGMKDEALAAVKKLLCETDGMVIVDKYLIPALDIVGQKYEKGDVFLPQLIQSAETVKGCFEIIKETVNNTDAEARASSKGKILLATVRGDIHDIGKNIVKILLQNYGFQIIDMGRDVKQEDIAEKVRQENIKLVGLSALMTTTVKSMESTIKLLRENNLDCKIVVGGAVLNQVYSDMIGADYYAKDARETVKIAQTFFESII